MLISRLLALVLAVFAVPLWLTWRMQRGDVAGWWSLVCALGVAACFLAAVAGRGRAAAWCLWCTTAAGALLAPLAVAQPLVDAPWLAQLLPVALGVTPMLSRRHLLPAAAAVGLLLLGLLARSEVLLRPAEGALARFVGLVGFWWFALAVVRSVEFGQRRLDRLRGEAVEDYVAARAEEATVRAEQAWDAYLHDEVIAALSAVAEGTPQVAREGARDLLTDIRRQVHDEVPSPWIGAGTIDEVLRLRPDADTDLVIDASAPAFPEPVRRAILEALTEAVRNVGRHAYPDGQGPCRVSVRLDHEEVRVGVGDEGRGFDPGSVQESRLGLAVSVVARMDAVGGWAVVDSAPGRGTRVEVGWRRGQEAVW